MRCAVVPKLDGYVPEVIKPEHWKNDAIRPALLEFTGNIAFDLGTADLRPFCSPVQNQLRLGSCVAQASIHALELKRIQKYGREKHVDLSTLHLYYLAREQMSHRPTHLDSGTHISCAMDALRKIGVCSENLWPYDTRKFAVAPPVKAIRQAYVNKIQAFHRITSTLDARITDILIHLHAGNPVVYGTTLNKSFFNVDKHTVVGAFRGSRVGRHAMCVVGWLHDHEGGCFVIQNSWGTSWGDGGFFYASPDHLSDPEAKDLWVITGGFEDWSPNS